MKWVWICALAVLTSGSAYAQRSKTYYPYRPQILDRPEWVWSEATGINELGEVVGQYELADGTYWSFYWSRTSGYKTICESTPVWNFSNACGAFDINEQDGVVGCYAAIVEQGVYWPQAYRWTPSTGQFQSIGGGSYPIPAMGSAVHINNAGVIAGNVDLFFSIGMPRLWTASTGVWDPSADTDWQGGGRLFDQNETGAILGYCERPGLGYFAYRRNADGEYSYLGNINYGVGFLGWGLNDLGDAVILRDNLHCNIWLANGSLMDMGLVQGGFMSPMDINNFNEVVGLVPGGFPVAGEYYWSKQTGYRKLDSLYPPSGMSITRSVAINDAGHIVGQAQAFSGRRSAVVLWRNGPVR